MSQHDMVISDADGATVLSDINAAYQALASTSKGTAAPSTVYAGQKWLDENTPSASKWSEYMNDGTDNIKSGEWDTTNNVYIGQVGGGAAQSIASAATVDLGSVFEGTIVVTGNTGPITSFGSSAPIGAFKFVKFSSTPTITHNATTMILPGGADLTMAANDCLITEHLGSGNWRVHNYSPAAGTPTAYAVGSWTPTITFATPGDLSVAYTTQTGTYTKIGRLVTLSFSIVTSTFTHTTASGALIIGGIPFNHMTQSGLVSNGSLEWQRITKANFTHMNVNLASAGSTMSVTASGSGQSLATIGASDMPTAGTAILRGTISYPA